MNNPSDLSSIWSLAATPEMIPRRLTSQLILSTLDEILNAAAMPLFSNTTYMRRLLMQMLMQFSMDNRRKLSALPRGPLYGLLLKAVLTGNFDNVMQCKLDRSLLFRLVTTTYDQIKDCPEMEAKIASSKGFQKRQLLLRRKQISIQIGTPENLLAPLALWVKGYIQQYNHLQWMIVTKYLKLAYHHAIRSAYNTKMHIDRKELFRNLVLAICRAIDKCDQTKGTLTNYVEQWFMSASNHPEFPHQYNVSYVLPPAVRRQLEKDGGQLNDFVGAMPHEDMIVDASEHGIEYRLRQDGDKGLLAALRYTRKAEIAMLALNIPIILTAAEINRLRGEQTEKA